jgi:hypothetical protein
MFMKYMVKMTFEYQNNFGSFGNMILPQEKNSGLTLKIDHL